MLYGMLNYRSGYVEDIIFSQKAHSDDEVFDNSQNRTVLSGDPVLTKWVMLSHTVE